MSCLLPWRSIGFLPFTLEVHRFPLLGSVGQATYHRLRSGSPSSRRRPSGPPPCPLPPLTPGVEPLLFSAGGNVSGSRATGGGGCCRCAEGPPLPEPGGHPRLPGRNETSRRPPPPGLLTSPLRPLRDIRAAVLIPTALSAGTSPLSASPRSLRLAATCQAKLPSPQRERLCNCTHRHSHANMRTPDMHTHVCTYPHTGAFPPQSCLCPPHRR